MKYVRNYTFTELFSLGKDATWMAVMGLVCVTTFAISSVMLKYAPSHRP